MKESIIIICAIITGVIFPYGAEYTYLIKYILSLILFLSFIDLDFSTSISKSNILKLLIANIIIGPILYLVLSSYSDIVRISILLICLTPPAAATTVLASILKFDVKFIAIYVLISTVVLSIIFSISLPLLKENPSNTSFVKVLVPMLSVIISPILLSEFIRRTSNLISNYIGKVKFITPYLLAIILYIASSHSSLYIFNYFNLSKYNFIILFILSGLAFLINSFLGYYLSSKGHNKEGRLALGHKNTTLAVWIAIEFLNPIVVLVPIIYSLIQNTYNSIQIFERDRRLKYRERQK